jgi:hypothetical protein
MSSAAVILGVISFVLCVWGASLIVRALTERAEVIVARRRAGKAGTPALVFGRVASAKHARAAIGLGLVSLVLGIAAAYGAVAINSMVSSGDVEVSPWTMCLLGLVALSIACAMTGWWFDPPRGRRRCPTCWYDLAATPGMTCPECGHTAAEESRLFRIRRKPALIWLAALLLLVASSLPGVRRVVNGKGIGGLIPTTLLIAGFTWLPEELIATPQNTGILQTRLNDDNGWPWQREWLQAMCVREARSPRSAIAYSRADMFRHRTHRTTEAVTEDAVRVLLRDAISADAMRRRAAIESLSIVVSMSKPIDSVTLTDEHVASLERQFRIGPLAETWHVPALLVAMGRETEALQLLREFDHDAIPANRFNTWRIGHMWSDASARSNKVADLLADRIESATPAQQRGMINYSMTEMFERSGRLREAVERIARDSPDDLTAAQALVPLMWHEESLNDDMIDRLVHFLRTRSSSHVTAVKSITGHVRNSTLAPPVADRLAGLILDSTLDEATRAEIARFMMEYCEAEQVLPALPALRTLMQSSSTLSTDPTLSRLLAKLEYHAAVAAAARSDSTQEVPPTDAPNTAEPADDAVPTSSEPPR